VARTPRKPVLLLAGEYDVGLPRNAAESAGLFEHAGQGNCPAPGTSFPWLYDPAWFTRTLAAFLG
jgi:proline iminopeptidase